MADILDMLEETEWKFTAGRPRDAEPSPYLPAIVKSAEKLDEKSKLGKAFAFTVNVGTGSPDDQQKELTKHMNLLRKAGRQHTPPVTVLIQAGDIDRKKGEVKLTFVAREKIAVKPKDAPVAPTSETPAA